MAIKADSVKAMELSGCFARKSAAARRAASYF